MNSKLFFASIFICLFNLIGIFQANGQVPSVPALNFNIPDTVEVGQNVQLINNSTAIPPGTFFTWEIETKTDHAYQAKDSLVIISTTSLSPINFVFGHDGNFRITLKSPGLADFQKTIWVKGLIGVSCAQYLANYTYADCEFVTNGSFEDYTALAAGTYNPSINNFCPWRFNPWIYSLGSADQYHQNNSAQILSVPNNGVGFQQAASGSGYAGLLTYTPGGSREYFFADLKEPLQPGAQYNVKFKVSLAEGASHATKVSVCLVNSPTQTSQNWPSTQGNNIINVNPSKCITSGVVTDKNGWTEVSGVFNASSASPESKIIIGHFNLTGQSSSIVSVGASQGYPTLNQQLGAASYYYIDDISVKPAGFCHCPADKSFGTDLNSVTYTSQLNMSPGQSASIIGNLVVNSSQFTMNNLNLKFAPGSKITVPAGTKLQVVNGSVLEACTEMWQGIDAPGEVFIFGATIRDAHSALNFTFGSVWNIQNSVLENNRRHIFVNCPAQAGFFASSIIKSNLLRCNPSQMKPPFANQYTYNAIELINVRTLYVGATGPVAGRNEISNAYRGIYAEKAAALYVRNNHFENIKCHNLPGIVCGKGTDLNVAILVNAPKLTDPLSSLYAGINGNILARNTFNNCTGGIYGIGNVYAELYQNNMSQIRDYGIYAMNNNKVNNMLLAQENTISHAKTGIYVYNPGNRPVWVLLNNINKLNNLNSQPTYGIRLENPLASSQAAVIINGNTVSKYRFGIHLSQFTSPRVTNNTVFTDANATAYPEGIRANNSPKAYIAQNSITENGSGAGQSIGIRVEYSPAASTLCNNIYSNQISMFFGGDQLSSTVGANYMHNGRTGVYVNWGQIGVQGPPKTAHMNAWYGNTWNEHLYAFGNGSGGSASAFWLKFNGSVFWPSNFISIGDGCPQIVTWHATQTDNSDIANFVWNCRDVMGDLEDRNEILTGLLNDSTGLDDSLAFKDEIVWSREMALYRMVKEDTTGMLDEDLYQYKMSVEATSKGMLDAAKDSLLNGNTADAQTRLTATAAADSMESYLKTVYGLITQKSALTDSVWEFSESEKAFLEELAGQCVYKYGEAVYSARNLIYYYNPDTLFETECEAVNWNLQKKADTGQAQEKESSVLVYPNPSADNFVFVLPTDITGGRVEIYDLQGRPVGVSESFKNSGVHLLNGSGLSSGFYLYRVYDDAGKMIGNGKLEKL